jgi:HK97 family phage portal protein
MGNFFSNIFKRKAKSLTPNQNLSTPFGGFSFGTINADGFNLASNTNESQAPQNNWALLEIFNNVAEVSAPIRYIASNAAQIKPDLERLKGKEYAPVEDKLDRFAKLLHMPNPLQTWPEFYAQLLASYKLYGNYFVYAQNAATLNYPTALWVLPVPAVTILVRVDNNRALTGAGEFEVMGYKIQLDSTVEFITASEVLHGRDVGLSYLNNNYMWGVSPLRSNADVINSLIAGRQAKKTIYQSGGFHVLTPASTGGEAAILNPLNPKDASAAQDRLNRYGMTDAQHKFMVLSHPMQITRVSHNIGELKIDESNLADFRAICRALGVPSVLMSDTESSTYNNVENARKQYFRGEFQSVNNQIYNDLSEFITSFGAWSAYRITPNYSGIADIQQDLSEKNEFLWPFVTSGLMTRNEYLIEMGRAAVSDIEFEKFYIFANNTWTPVTNNVDTNTNTNAND